MPRAPARIRKRFIEGQTEVLPWDVEETLIYGYPLTLDSYCTLPEIDQWHVAWNRWRDVVLPKVLEHRPGTRPVAMYVLGEIEPRELTVPLPESHGYRSIRVRHRNGRVDQHWLNVPTPFMVPEVQHLRRLGVVGADELKRHRAWMRTPNPECGTCAVDTYPLETSLYE